MTKEQFGKYISNFDFPELFRTQGWDNFTAAHKIEAQKSVYNLTGVAQKKNFPILQCVSNHNKIPDLNNRKLLEKKIRPLYFEHLLIIINKERTWQYWQLPLYEDNKLKNLVSFAWNKGQDVESIFQKLRNIIFTLDEEDIITLADVKERVNTLSTNSEKVTKKFYAEFIKQHRAFLGFIKGIEDALPDNENEKKQWYASLMLNRLMFCYFIQRKRFLDWNPDYLREKLTECKKLTGKNNFNGFYRSFLLELFHNELGRPEDKRLKRVSPVPFGAIPYLNGGLFDVHELESDYKSISIKDEAFGEIFAFFDEWNWHLDTRISASGKDINPDVIGYIFEKYINQKEMGAYYTKEDITDYIGKNTIIPFLLEKVKSCYPASFEPGYGFWQYLQDSGDEYIYESVKKGAEGLLSIDDVNIPENIRMGIDTSKPNLLDRRKDWNTLAPGEIGLPTEIWRETIVRLQRYFELKTKIKKGNLQDINDLITYNLNIRKLVKDYLDQTQDPKFIREFHKALCGITILDPTCGSGAFLFAALNILQPLYEVCIQRMEEFNNANPGGNKDFHDCLDHKSGDHPNMSYYIFKTIILNNLYGVDLMKEAVEIAKLRFFLKLVAEVDPSRRKKNFGLEPLPDIDFNIRSGNTLVGFATERQLDEVVRMVDGDLIFEERFEELKSACRNVAASYEHFQAVQISMGSDSEKYKDIKKSMSKELKILDEKLSCYLADTYGLGTQTQGKSRKEKEDAYREWKDKYRAFHWLAEFYEIISKGGFDVVIGNPPYVEYSKVRNSYEISGYATNNCGNLYAFVMERISFLTHNHSILGLIVPMSITSIRDYKELRSHLNSRYQIQWISNHAIRPMSLFVDVSQRVSVFFGKSSTRDKLILHSTRYLRYKTEMNILFQNITWHITLPNVFDSIIPKIGTNIDMTILKKLILNNNDIEFKFADTKNHVMYIKDYGETYWIFPFDFIPYLSPTKSFKELSFRSANELKTMTVILNSSMFYWFYTLISDCWHFGKWHIQKFQASLQSLMGYKTLLVSCHDRLTESYKKNRIIRYDKRIDGDLYEYRISKSKSIIDEIDNILAKHYGFTEEELDYIINYDIKYRMGSELEGTDG